MARDELAPASAQLRFEAVYFGVVAALGMAVFGVRFDLRGTDVGVGLLAGLAVCVLSLAFSVANRAPRPQRDRAQQLFPLVMGLALLALAGGRTLSVIAAGCLAGMAIAPLIGYLAILRARTS